MSEGQLNSFPEELKNCSILIVDDMSFYLSFLKQALKNLGHNGDIHAAPDMNSAINLINSVYHSGKRIDLIISDFHLGKHTGVDFVAKVRSNDILKNLPFIIFTTDENGSNVIKAFDAGVDDYFFKPIDESILVKKIINSFEKRSKIK